MVAPIFLFSLPRSGSTLLQRVLSTHHEVATAAEPWLLLPLFGALGGLGTFSQYNHESATYAINAFLELTPNGRKDFYEAVSLFACRLYDKAGAEHKYFLDKTPRYHVIGNEIMQSFPTGKFIFLVRNPMAIYASIINTWQQAHVFKYDLYLGFERFFENLETPHSNIHIVRYEELVSSPEQVVRSICEYLDLDFQPGMITSFSQIGFAEGAMGNPAPRQLREKHIYTESSNKWQGILNDNIFRRKMALSYLNFIGSERMQSLGYDFLQARTILSSKQITIKNLGLDIANYFRGAMSIAFETPMLRRRISSMLSGARLYAHR